MEEVPSWEIIDYALKSLFAKHPSCNFKGIGLTQRLEYKEMENLLYNLFLIIEPTSTRQLFRVMYPSRNIDDRIKFMDQAVAFINKRQLSSDRVSSSRLRMCGGEPFRRLLSSLIKRAAEVEIAANAKKLGLDKSVLFESKLDDCYESLDSEKKSLEESLNQLREKNSLYERLQETLDDKKKTCRDSWNSLTCCDQKSSNTCEPSETNLKSVYKSLLSRLQTSNEKSSTTIEKINDIDLAEEEPNGKANTAPTKPDPSKRVSHLVREMRKCLTLSPENERVEEDKTSLVSDIDQQLSDYDEGVTSLISRWEKLKEKTDEGLLNKPEFLERYKFYEKLIPFIDVEPLFSNTKSCKPLQVKFAEVREVLSEYPDPEFDDKEILDVAGKYFTS